MVRTWWVVFLLAACGAAPDKPFDGERAFVDLQDQVRIGPRPAGSEGAAATRDLIRQRLRQAGWPVVEHRFRLVRPDGVEVEGVNLRARLPGERSDPIWLGAHYDTKDIPGVRFVGANDGASGVAVLLELARTLGRERRPFTIELVFFDGEEAFGRNINARDGLYGSRALAAALVADGSLARIRALILVDMVADRDLNLSVDTTSAPWLRTLLRDAQEDLGEELVDPTARVALVDDHTPFQDAGLEDTLALIDFQFGARRQPGPLWHTAGDDLEAVSAESLNRVGGLLVQTLERVELWLVGDARASDGPGR